MGQDVLIKQNYVRFEPVSIAGLFPETATIDSHGNLSIDYTSFIPILMKALNEQQKFILELEQKIQELESKIQN